MHQCGDNRTYTNILTVTSPRDNFNNNNNVSASSNNNNNNNNINNIDNKSELLMQNSNGINDSNNNNQSATDSTEASTTRERMLNQKSSYTKLELNKSGSSASNAAGIIGSNNGGVNGKKSSVFESKAAVKLKSPTSMNHNVHQIRQIKHGHMTEEEEKEVFFEECNKILFEIKELCNSFDSLLNKNNYSPFTNSLQDEIKKLLPMLEGITSMVNYQEQLMIMLEESEQKSPNAVEELKEVTAMIEKKKLEMLKKQWKIEQLVPPESSLAELFGCLHVLEESDIYLENITIDEIFKVDKTFISSTRKAITTFTRLRQRPIPSEVELVFPEAYVLTLTQRIDRVSGNLARTTDFVEYLESAHQFMIVNDLINKQFVVNGCDYSNIDILQKKHKCLKELSENGAFKEGQNIIKTLKEAGSKIINNHFTKSVSKQITINMCSQKTIDMMKASLKKLEEILKEQKKLLEKWINLKKYSQSLEDWLRKAEEKLDEIREEREQFFSTDKSWDDIYISYKNAKVNFPDVDQACSAFIESEFNRLTNEWNDIVTKLDQVRQKEKVNFLKKEFAERIERIEKWLDKSETVLERKVDCSYDEADKYLAILEAAIQQAETVKADLQSAAKIGESMYKSNMQEEEVEEILGRLKISKERFIKVRDNLNVKLKKVKKLHEALHIYKNNFDAFENWATTGAQFIESIPDTFAATGSYDEWNAKYQDYFGEKQIQAMNEKMSENNRIIERIREKLIDEVDISVADMVSLSTNEKLTANLKRAEQRKKEAEFKRDYNELGNLIGEINGKIEAEEALMTTENDLQKILTFHQDYFDGQEKLIKCQKLIAKLKESKLEMENVSEENKDDTLKPYNEMLMKAESWFNDVSLKENTMKETLLTLPDKLNDFQEKMSGITNWIQNVKELSMKLEVSEDQIDSAQSLSKNSENNAAYDMMVNSPEGFTASLHHTPTAEEYKATLSEFQQVTQLAQAKMAASEELSRLLNELNNGSAQGPIMFLAEQQRQLAEILQECQAIEPKIEKVLNTAPVVAKSIEFKEEVVKRSEKLMQLKNNIDKIQDDAMEMEQFDDIYEQEQKIMASLEKEAPEIMSELAEAKELQNQSEAAKIISSTPADLENTYNIVRQAMNNRLVKLRETKETWEGLEKTANETKAYLTEIDGSVNKLDLKNLKGNELKNLTDELNKLKQKICSDVSDKINKFKQEMEKGKSKLNNQRRTQAEENYAELNKLKEVNENMIADLIKKVDSTRDVLNEWNEKLEDTLRNFDERKSILTAMYDKLGNTEVDDIKRDIAVIENELRDAADEFSSIYKGTQNNLDSNFNVIADEIEQQFKTIQESSGDSNVVIDKIESYLNLLGEYNNVLDNEDSQLDELISEIENIEPDKLKYEHWKATNAESITKPMKKNLKSFEKKINESVKPKILGVNPQNHNLNEKLNAIMDKVLFTDSQLNEIEGGIQDNLDFIKLIKSDCKNKLDQLKVITNDIQKLTKNKSISFDERSKLLNEKKDNVLNLSEECNKLKTDIENKNDDFCEELIDDLFNITSDCNEKIADVLNLIQQKLEEENDNYEKYEYAKENIDGIQAFVEKINCSLKENEIGYDCLDELIEKYEGTKKDIITLKDVKCEELSKLVEDIKHNNKNEEVLQVFNNFKNIKNNLVTLLDDIKAKVDYLDSCRKFKQLYEDTDELLNNTYLKLESCDVPGLDSLAENNKKLSDNIEYLKKTFKNTKTFPVKIVSEDDEYINFSQLSKELQGRFNDLIKAVDETRKSLTKRTESTNKFNNIHKSIQEAMSKLKVRVEKLTVKELKPQILQGIINEAEEIEKDLQKQQNSIEELRKVQQKLILDCNYDNENEYDDIIEKICNEMDRMTINFNQKHEVLKFLNQALKDYDDCINHINSIKDTFKENLRIKNVFKSFDAMEHYIHEMESRFYANKEEIEELRKDLNKILSNIKTEAGIFNGFSVKPLMMEIDKSLESHEQNIKTFGNLLTSLREELGVIKRAEILFENLSKQIRKAVENIQEVADSKMSLSSELDREIKLKEEELKNFKNIEKELLGVLNKNYKNLDLSDMKINMKDIENMLSKMKALIERIKEKNLAIAKEKELMQKKLQSASSKMKEITDKLDNCFYRQSKNEDIAPGVLEDLEHEAKLIANEINKMNQQVNGTVDYAKDKGFDDILDYGKRICEEVNNFSGRNKELQKKIKEKAAENLRKAKEDHEAWMRETEAKLNDTNINISEQLSNINNVLDTLDKGKGITDDVIVKTITYQTLSQPYSNVEVNEVNIQPTYASTEMQNQLQNIAAMATKKKEDLERANNELTKQKEVTNAIEDRIPFYKSEISELLNANIDGLEDRKKILRDAEKIMNKCEDDLQQLWNVEPKFKDVAIKENAQSIMKMMQDIQSQARNVEAVQAQKIQDHEMVLHRLSEMNKSVKDFIDTVMRSEEVKGIDSIYLNRLDHKIKDSKAFTVNVENNISKLLSNSGIPNYETSRPSDIKVNLHNLELNLDALQRKCSQLENEKQISEELLNQWNESLVVINDDLESVHKEIEQENVLVACLEETEEKLRSCLNNSQQLDSLKSKVKSLDDMANQLMSSEYRKEIIQLNQKLKQLKSTNLDNQKTLTKSLNQQKDYQTKLKNVENRINSLEFGNSDSNNVADITTLKNEIGKLQRMQVKIKEVKKEMDKIEKSKNALLSQLNEFGQSDIKSEFSEIKEKLTNIERSAEVNLKERKKEMENIDVINDGLSQVKDSLNRQEMQLQNKNWSSDPKINNRILDEKSNKVTELEKIEVKLNTVERLMAPLKQMPDSVKFTHSECKNKLDKMKAACNEDINDGENIQFVVGSLKEKLESLNRRQAQCKKEIHELIPVTKPNQLDANKEKIRKLSEMIADFENDCQDIKEELGNVKQFGNVTELQRKVLEELNKCEQAENDMSMELKEKLTEMNAKEKSYLMFCDEFDESNRRIGDLCERFSLMESANNHPEERMKIIEEIIEDAEQEKEKVAQLKGYSQRCGFETAFDSTKRLSTTLNQLVSKAKENLSSAENQIEKSNHYYSELAELNKHVDVVKERICDLSERRLTNIEDTTKCRVKLLDFKREIENISDELLILEGKHAPDISRELNNNNSKLSCAELRDKMAQINKSVDSKLDECSKELECEREFQQMAEQLEGVFGELNTELILIERENNTGSRGGAKDLDRIKAISARATEAEKQNEKLKSILMQSELISKSSFGRSLIHNNEKQLVDAHDRCERATQQIKEKIKQKEMYYDNTKQFDELQQLAESKTNQLERANNLDGKLVEELEKLGRKMKDVQVKINSTALTGGHDWESDEAQRKREEKMTNLETTIHNAKKAIRKVNDQKRVSEENVKKFSNAIKDIKDRFEIVKTADDLVMLQNNETTLNSLLFELAGIDNQMRDMRNKFDCDKDRSGGVKTVVQDVDELFGQIVQLEQRIQMKYQDSRKSIGILKTHKNKIGVAKSFLKHCQQKHASISYNTKNPYQLECELDKVETLLESIARNSEVESNLDGDDLSLQEMSGDGINKIQKEIEEVHLSFEKLREALIQEKLNLSKAVEETNKYLSEEQALSNWLKKQMKELKSCTDQWDNLDHAKQGLEGFQILQSNLKAKESIIQQVLQKSPLKGSKVNKANLAEIYDETLALSKKKENEVDKVITELEILKGMLEEWNSWYGTNKSIRTLFDKKEKVDLAKNLLDKKQQKYEDIIRLAAKSESILGHLTQTGREEAKVKVNTVREQWHELFDGLALSIDKMEDKFKRRNDIIATLDNVDTEVDRIQKLLNEELETWEPPNFCYRSGLEEKEKQLHKLEVCSHQLGLLGGKIKNIDRDGQEELELKESIVEKEEKFNEVQQLLDWAVKECKISRNNYLALEDIILRTDDILNVKRRRLALCQDAEGSSESVDARINRLQELQDDDNQYIALFDQLEDSLEKSVTSSNPEETKYNRDRVSSLRNRQKELQQATEEWRNKFQLLHSDLQKFKLLSENVDGRLREINDRINLDNSSLREIASFVEEVNKLAVDGREVEDLALKILENSRNNFPLYTIRLTLLQIDELSKKLEQKHIDLLHAERGKEDYANKSELFETYIKEVEKELTELNEMFNAVSNKSELDSIAEQYSFINGKKTELQEKADELKNVYDKIQKTYPKVGNELKPNYSSIKKKQAKLDNQIFNQFTQFTTFNKHYQQLSKKLEDKFKELDSVINFDFDTGNSVPDEKVGKINRLSDLNDMKMIVTNIRNGALDVSVGNVCNAHNQLIGQIEMDRNKIIKATNELINKIDNNIKTISKCLKDQTQLEKEVKQLRESLDCLSDGRSSIKADLTHDFNKFEDVIKNIDQNINMAVSLKRNVDYLKRDTMDGCAYELTDLKGIRKETEAAEKDFRLLKDELVKRHRSYNEINEVVNGIKRDCDRYEEDIANLKEVGITINNKKALLDKSMAHKEKIMELNKEIENVNVTCIERFPQYFDSILEQLESKNKEQLCKLELIIETHKNSIELDNKFNEMYKDDLRMISELKLKAQQIESGNSNEALPNLTDLTEQYNKLLLVSNQLNSISSEEGKVMITSKLSHLEKSFKNLDIYINKLKINEEKKQYRVLEYTKQESQLNSWLNNIKENVDSIKFTLPESIDEFSEKCHQYQKIHEELKEWKEEMNDHFDKMKELKQQADSNSNLSNEYRKLIAVVSEEMLKCKESMETVNEYKSQIENAEKELRVIEGGKILLANKSVDNVTEIKTSIKDCFQLKQKLQATETKIETIEKVVNKLKPVLSFEGQQIINDHLSNLTEQRRVLEQDLMENKENLEKEKFGLVGFENCLNSFEEWLTDAESKIVSRGLLTDLSDKMCHLETCQRLMLDIVNKKEEMDKIVQMSKDWSMNLNVNHSVRGIQSRYNNLYTNLQNLIDCLAKWVANHQSYENSRSKFIENRSGCLVKLNSFMNKTNKVDVNADWLHELDAVAKEIDMLDGLKLELDSLYKIVITETNDKGKSIISADYIEEMEKLSKLQSGLISCKAEYSKLLSMKQDMTSLAEDATKWIQTLTVELQKPVDQTSSGLSHVEYLLQLTNERKSNLIEIQNANLNIVVAKLMEDLDSNEDELKNRKESILKFINLSDEYNNVKDKFIAWLYSVKEKIYNVSEVKGSQYVISRKITELTEINKSINSDGKQYLDTILEMGNLLIKRLSDREEKESLVKEVDKLEQEYFNQVNKLDECEKQLKEFMNRWNSYDHTIQLINRFLKQVGNKKTNLLDTKMPDSNTMVDNFEELYGEINQEKNKIELFLKEVEQLREISGEIQVELTVADYLDQIESSEMDIKFQLDKWRNIKAELTEFQSKHGKIQTEINKMRSELQRFKQLTNVDSYENYQEIYSEFQVLESKLLESGSRITELTALSARLFNLLPDDNKDIKETIDNVQNDWNLLKVESEELRNQMGKLSDLWLNLKLLMSEIENWNLEKEKEIAQISEEGYINAETNEANLSKLKNIKLVSEIIRQKILKSIELHYKSESYLAFCRKIDPLQLQKCFLEIMENVSETEKRLIKTGRNIDKFQSECAEAEKWILDLSVSVTQIYKKTGLINTLDETVGQLKICRSLDQKITDFDTNKITGQLIKEAEQLDKLLQMGKGGVYVRSEISKRMTELNRNMRQLKLLVGKLQTATKERKVQIKKYQLIMENLENYIYQELPDWWVTHEQTLTKNPDDCENLIGDVSDFIDCLTNLNAQFEEVCHDNIRQKKLAESLQKAEDESEDGDYSDNYKATLTDLHLDQLKNDLKCMMEKLKHKMDELNLHKKQWLQIEEDINDLSNWMMHRKATIDTVMHFDVNNEDLLDKFENTLKELISKRNQLDKLHIEILGLNGNHDFNDPFGTSNYPRYQSVCQQYSDLLTQIETARANNASLNARKLYEELMNEQQQNWLNNEVQTDDIGTMVQKSDFINGYNKKGTQTNRSRGTSTGGKLQKAGSVSDLRRQTPSPTKHPYIINRRDSGNSTLMSTTQLSVGTGTGDVFSPNNSKKNIRRSVTGLNTDSGIQSGTAESLGYKTNKSLSNMADKVMHDRYSFEKVSGNVSGKSHPHRATEKKMNGEAKKQQRMEQLQGLLSTIMQIKSEVKSIDPSLSNPRQSIESVRRNMVSSHSPTRKRKSTARKKDNSPFPSTVVSHRSPSKSKKSVQKNNRL